MSETLKLMHVGCAFLSIAGFVLRGYWMAVESPLLQHRTAKVLPHVIDTLLLVSAIALLVIMKLSPLAHGWLVAKVIALLVYIGLGMMALRFGQTRRSRMGAWLLALLTVGYIVSVAYTRNPWGFFAGAFLQV